MKWVIKHGLDPSFLISSPQTRNYEIAVTSCNGQIGNQSYNFFGCLLLFVRWNVKKLKRSVVFRSRTRKICDANGGRPNLQVSIHLLQSTFSKLFDACSRFCICESRKQFVSSSWHGAYLGGRHLHLAFQDVCCNSWPRDWCQLYHRLVCLSRSAVWGPAWTSKIWTFYNWNKMQPSGFLTGIATDVWKHSCSPRV